MATTTLTFDDLVAETFSVLYRHVERPRYVAVASDALVSASDTNFTVDDPDVVNRTDFVEFPDGEQALVVGKSDLGVLTVSRGYNNTEALTGHATTSVVKVNPQFGLLEVERWVKRYFERIGTAHLPPLTTGVLFREPKDRVALIPAGAIDVLGVRVQATSGNIVDVAGWKHERNVPTTYYPTGQILSLPSTIDDDDELWVTYTTQYDTSGDTVVVPAGSEDLPVLFASAYAVGRREVSRMDLDAIQEWNQAAAIRNGQNIRLMRELWGEFYRSLDEAKKTYRAPRYRPYMKMPKIR